MTLGQRIQELRKQAGLSQEGLGEALGVSRQAVSKWEGDNGIPELDTLIAMSRRFGVTLGQLLGVEEPAPQEEDAADGENPAAASQEQVEAILRRYVEESRQHEPPKRRFLWLWPLGACCLLLAAVIVLFVQTRQVKQNIDNLWDNVININSATANIRNQIGGLSDELRDILEEQSDLLSTFNCQVVDFDVEKKTVDVELTATLKTYSAGEMAQFCLSWIKTDETTGKAVTDPVEGPEFKTTITIPMNFHLEVTVRLIATDGTIREQPAGTFYGGMHPGEFTVQGGTLSFWKVHSEGRCGYQIELHSSYPERIYPVKAVVVTKRNGEEIDRLEVALGQDTFLIQNEIVLAPFREDDILEVRCYVTDNYGRVTEFDLN